MAQDKSYQAWLDMLNAAQARIADNEEQLGALDAHAGDGDHGASMNRAMGAVREAIEGMQGEGVEELLKKVSGNLLRIDAGAIGPLLGTLFRGLAKGAAEGKGLNAGGLADMFRAGLDALRGQTKAQPGDKTLMDALVPAVEAMEGAAASGANARSTLAQAADAAAAGAAATTDQVAKYGRARNLGEQSKGVADPGATSLSLMLRGFADAVRDLLDDDDDPETPNA